jgi:hypothetical protein
MARRLNGDPKDLIRTMPAKGDRPAGPCLGEETRETSPPGTGPQDLAAAARAVGITDPRVLEAIRLTPRTALIPAAYATGACDDAHPHPHPQVTTPPSLSAAMTAALA